MIATITAGRAMLPEQPAKRTGGARCFSRLLWKVPGLAKAPSARSGECSSKPEMRSLYWCSALRGSTPAQARSPGKQSAREEFLRPGRCKSYFFFFFAFFFLAFFAIASSFRFEGIRHTSSRRAAP